MRNRLWMIMLLVALFLGGCGFIMHGDAAEDPEDPGKVTDVTIVNSSKMEAMWISRYSVSDMKFKPAMLGLNLLPAECKYFDTITLIGTEDITTAGNINRLQFQVGLGVRTNFEALDFSDDVARWLDSKLNLKLPEGLSIGPNLNPYGVIDPIESATRIINVVQGSSFKKEFDKEFWQDHSDIGIMTEFIKYTIEFD